MSLRSQLVYDLLRRLGAWSGKLTLPMERCEKHEAWGFAALHPRLNESRSCGGGRLLACTSGHDYTLSLNVTLCQLTFHTRHV